MARTLSDIIATGSKEAIAAFEKTFFKSKGKEKVPDFASLDKILGTKAAPSVIQISIGAEETEMAVFEENYTERLKGEKLQFYFWSRGTAPYDFYAQLSKQFPDVVFTCGYRVTDNWVYDYHVCVFEKGSLTKRDKHSAALENDVRYTCLDFGDDIEELSRFAAECLVCCYDQYIYTDTDLSGYDCKEIKCNNDGTFVTSDNKKIEDLTDLQFNWLKMLEGGFISGIPDANISTAGAGNIDEDNFQISLVIPETETDLTSIFSELSNTYSEINFNLMYYDHEEDALVDICYCNGDIVWQQESDFDLRITEDPDEKREKASGLFGTDAKGRKTKNTRRK